MQDSDPGQPRQIFNNLSAAAVVIGIVVGIGIFRLPSMVAQNASSELHYLGFWLAGGIISILGALCYAELASAKPDAGGEYHFLTEAYGPAMGFLFSWGRMSVIQTGSIALAAFILGDYAATIYSLGPQSSAIYAAITVITLTGLNIWGTQPSKNVQNLLSSLIVIVLLAAGISGLIEEPMAWGNSNSGGVNTSAGAAMIFVLLTYGGWNEGVYLSAELKEVRQNISRVLLLALATITVLYLLINVAYVQVLGMETLRNSATIGVTLSDRIVGSGGAYIMALFVIISALSTANATIITGARTNYAQGRDFPLLGFLGRWNTTANAPVNALLLQGGIALALVGLGSFTQEAVSTMVDYTAPVFWFFILLTTASLFIFRQRTDASYNPGFHVPFYPLTPILFMLVCLYLLYSSVVFTGAGALIGIGILLLGLPVYALARKRTA
ncbi:APC family permease [Fodinibius sediminis]|uniref:Amino acid/polyamine/organocation transporter, APC superfamily n=1 Tax=Fodinibius sediminis TaxID=1214077 RepID=A0A521B6C9_9BACT|nr:amino acid permease [Fodinibius sediminis]SMO42220.1 amino acid/polyamine/organocation transporter, APC superfamily [Fodinibius sediminis]